MVSRYVVEIIQAVALVLALVGALLIYAHRGRFYRALVTALAMGALGVLAVLAGTLPKGPGIPILLFIVGFIVAALAPRVIKVGNLTDNQLRAIGFLLASLVVLIQFLLSVLDLLGIKIV